MFDNDDDQLVVMDLKLTSDEARETTVNDLLQQAIRSAADEYAVSRAASVFTHGFALCMEQEGVNLDAAITMQRTLVERDVDEFYADNVRERARRLLFAALDRAEDEMREVLDEARRLVKVADEGSPEPKPYNREKHLAARARRGFPFDLAGDAQQG